MENAVYVAPTLNQKPHQKEHKNGFVIFAEDLDTFVNIQSVSFYMKSFIQGAKGKIIGGY